MENQTKNVSTNLLQAIVNYLVLKPYNEVAQLLGAIQNELNVVPEEKKEEEEKEEKE